MISAAGTASASMLKRLLTELANQEHVSDVEEEEDRIRWATSSIFSGKPMPSMSGLNLIG